MRRIGDPFLNPAVVPSDSSIVPDQTSILGPPRRGKAAPPHLPYPETATRTSHFTHFAWNSRARSPPGRNEWEKSTACFFLAAVSPSPYSDSVPRSQPVAQPLPVRVRAVPVGG